MPIYEYFCPQCNLKFELLRPLDQSNVTASCPRCHNEANRMVSSFTSASKGTEEVSPPIGGSSPCSTCSALTCAACNR
ncbi:MAG: zinc ribbon domain-containing protein [Dehalococcoidia bacterium]|nr:zinc ribbon domain-containing protein [Dehalococcoidia bacterium]